MKKIPTLFARNYDQEPKFLVRDEITPGCEWVAGGEGVATRKYDGQAALIQDGKLFWRLEVTDERLVGRELPKGSFIVARDDLTMATVFWVPVETEFEKFDPADSHFREAFTNHRFAVPTMQDYTLGSVVEDGTYELLGPRVQGNPEGMTEHVLLRHDFAQPYPDAPRTFAWLEEFFALTPIEGLVWHHPDGRMAKIKGRDFNKKHRKL